MMFKKIMIATTTTAALALTTAAPASAGPPAERACLGEFFSDSASTFGAGFGMDIVFFARNAKMLGLKNLGEGIQIVLAGESNAFPDECQPV